jgi:hypothetical protein
MADQKTSPADGTQKQDTGQKELVSKLRAFKKYARDFRVRYEVMWYELQLIKDGDHYKLVNRTANSSAGTVQVVPITKRPAEIRRTINKFRALLRSVKAFTTMTQVRFDVPGSSEEAQIASHYLNWFVESNDEFRRTIRNVLEYGFLRSVGYFDVYWDNDKLLPTVASRDPFDLLDDPSHRFMVKMYRKSLKDLREEKDVDNNPAFKDVPENLQATKKLSSSEIFQNYLAAKYNPTATQNKDVDEVMLEEYHVLGRDAEGKPKIDIITLCEEGSGDHVFREDVETGNDFRFIPYYPEERPNDIFNEPWFKDAVDPQRGINNVYTHIEEWIRTINKGRLTKHKDTKIDRISDKDGQIVEYDGPAERKPEWIQPPTMTNDPFNFLSVSERLMEDIIGIHPSEIRKTETATGIGFLISNDQTNMSEPFENLKTSLIKVAKRILKLSVKHMQVSKDIFWWEKGVMKEGQVISSEAENKPDAARLLKYFDTVRVELVPIGAFQALARRQELLDLYKAGVLKDPQTILEGGAYGDVKEITEREKAARAQEQMTSIASAGGGNPPTIVNPEAAPRQDLARTAAELKAVIGHQ